MAIRSSSSSGIPFGGTAGRPTSVNGQPYFNGDLGRLELYTTATGWQNIVQETPGVSGATGTYNQSANTGTFIISGTNFVSGAIVYAVGTNGTDYEASSTTFNSLVQLSSTFTNLSVAYEPYDIKVVNPSNLFGLLPDAFYINDSPVWSTSSGSLGTFNSGSSVSLQLAATDDESNTITYAIASGSLPGGLSLSSSGLISGTLVAPSGTTSFTLSASDGVNTAVTRAFSITCVAAAITGGTLTSDSTYYYRTFTGTNNLVISNITVPISTILIAGGGGGGGGSAGAGGGAGGLLYQASYSAVPQTYSIVIGAGGLGKSGQSGPGSGGDWGDNGENTTAFGYTAIGGGGGGGEDATRRAGRDGGSGGGACYASGFAPGLGTSGQGFNGGYGNVGYWAGGGGGAGAAGGNSSYGVSTGGNGGSGTNAYSAWITAINSGMAGVTGWSTATSTGYIAGGGGGAKQASTGSPGSGGVGGGGSGADDISGSGSVGGISGIANTGGGGGGNPEYGLRANVGNGGSGLVIVRYAKAYVGG